MRGPPRLPLVLPLLIFAVLSLAAGCGGAPAKGAEAPSSAVQEPEPATVEEAQVQLDRAKQQLGEAGGAPAQGSSATSMSQPSSPSGDAPTRHESKANAEPAATPSPCESPCRAIASMRRAVSAICRIAGDADARCDGAKKTLADSESRVKTCGC
jgi:hypothetical protein